MDCFYSLLLASVFVSVLYLPSTPAQRLALKDYVYNGYADAFYKLHTAPAHLPRAKKVCKSEGAELMIALSAEDKFQAAALMKEHEIEGLVWVAKDGRSSGRYDVALCHQALSRYRNITVINCSELLPFMCKVTGAKVRAAAKAAIAAEVCEPHGYRYYPETGSCYSVPPYAATWEKAVDYCYNETARLVVLNSKEEVVIVKSILEKAPPAHYTVNKDYVLAGFKAEKPSREFRDIFGKGLEAAWSRGEPNNGGGSEYCGSIYLATGLYNDGSCTGTYGFVCEKEVSLQQTVSTSDKNNIINIPTPSSDNVNIINIVGEPLVAKFS